MLAVTARITNRLLIHSRLRCGQRRRLQNQSFACCWRCCFLSDTAVVVIVGIGARVDDRHETCGNAQQQREYLICEGATTLLSLLESTIYGEASGYR
jgi:hypothetical protein